MKNNLKISEISIVIISYKSEKKVLKIILENKNVCKIIIIDNSNDKILKKKISKLNNKNIKIILSKNIGYARAANLGSRYVKTKYFVLINPDVNGINFHNLNKFMLKVNNIPKFGTIGPRYIGKTHKNLIQTKGLEEIEKINCISGSVMFFKLSTFNKLNKFDNNFFLYFEENDYCLRAVDKNYFNYQINSIKIKHEEGKSVNFENKRYKLADQIIRTWHFSWSKFYFQSKHYSYFFAFIINLPILFRSMVKSIFYKINNNKIGFIKYNARAEAIKTSLFKKKPYFKLSHALKKYDL